MDRATIAIVLSFALLFGLSALIWLGWYNSRRKVDQRLRRRENERFEQAMAEKKRKRDLSLNVPGEK